MDGRWSFPFGFRLIFRCDMLVSRSVYIATKPQMNHHLLTIQWSALRTFFFWGKYTIKNQHGTFPKIYLAKQSLPANAQSQHAHGVSLRIWRPNLKRPEPSLPYFQLQGHKCGLQWQPSIAIRPIQRHAHTLQSPRGHLAKPVPVMSCVRAATGSKSKSSTASNSIHYFWKVLHAGRF